MFLAAIGSLSDARGAIDATRTTSRDIDAIQLSNLSQAIIDLQAKSGRRPQLMAPTFAPLFFSNGHLDLVSHPRPPFPELAQITADDPKLEDMLTRLLVESHDADLGKAVGLTMPRPTRARERLSKRERDVWELIAQGRTNREIAKTLFISESTTKVHVHHILEKLGVRSRTEAVRVYLNEDLG